MARLAALALVSCLLAIPASRSAQASAQPATGYWLIRADGATYPLGMASAHVGPASTIRGLNRPIVGAIRTPDGQGLWMVAADGGVFTFGDARFYGSATELHLAAPIVGMAATPDGGGYWLLGADGGVITFGDATYLGRAFFPCSAPVGGACPSPVDEGTGIAASPDGAGYWIADTSGQVQHFGDAEDLGSYSGPGQLGGPVVGIVPSASSSASGGTGPRAQGYDLVGADGGVLTFGSAGFYGSAAGIHLAAPIAGMATTADGGGYWLVGEDGGVFSYGDAGFLGSDPGQTHRDPMVGLAPAS